jgi:large subunit ribosomal protein L25
MSGERRSKDRKMEKNLLDANIRKAIGKKVGALRRQSKLPAVMYGRNFESTPIVLDLRDTTRLLAKLTSSSLITITLDSKEYLTLVQERQRDFIRGTLQHIDFRVVALDEKIKASVPIEIIGIAPAIKDFNGVLISNLNTLDVECLAENLPERVTIDVSTLENIGDSIHVEDIDLGEDVDVLSLGDDVIVGITTIIEEIEEEVEEEEGELEEGEEELGEPEVIEKGKKEEEEGDE